MELDFVYEGTALGLLLILIGELFGIRNVALLGVGVFVASVLAGFPVMAADLVAGTLHESTAKMLDVDFDAEQAKVVSDAVITE